MHNASAQVCTTVKIKPTACCGTEYREERDDLFSRIPEWTFSWRLFLCFPRCRHRRCDVSRPESMYTNERAVIFALSSGRQ